MKTTKTIKNLWFFILVGGWGPSLEAVKSVPAVVISPPWKRHPVFNFSFVSRRLTFSLFSSLRFVRFASTKHQFFENRLKHVNPLAFYAETGFHRKNLISSNPSAFYVDLGAAASTKHTILKNPKGTSKGAPRDARGAQGTQGIPKGSLRSSKGHPRTPEGRTRSPKGRPRDVQGPPRTSKDFQGTSKEPPRVPQGLPKGSPRAPKRTSKRPQGL